MTESGLEKKTGPAMEAEKPLRQDWFLDPARRIWQHPDHFRFNTDTALLAKFMVIRPGETVIDIGTNNGVLLVYADDSHPALMTGIELLHEPAQVARLNLSVCRSPWEILEQPVQQVMDRKADVVISNPPYFSLQATDRKTPLTLRQQGRAEFHLTLGELCEAASRFLNDGGRFYLVHRPDRLQEILTVLEKHHLIVKRLQLVYDRRDSLCKSLLVEAMKNGRTGGLVMEPPLWIGVAAGDGNEERSGDSGCRLGEPDTLAV